VNVTSSTATTSPYVFRALSTATSAGSSRSEQSLQDVEAELELRVADREGDEDPDHVAVNPARQKDQPLLAGGGDDAARFVAGLLRQFDREHRAEASHLGAVGGHRLEPLPEALSDVLCAAALLGERVEDRRGGGARERIAAEGAAEASRRHRIHQLRTSRDGRERQAAAEGLPGDDQVGLDA